MLSAAWSLNIAVIGILGHLALSLFFSHGKQPQARYLIAFLVCVGCYSVHPFFEWQVFDDPGNPVPFLFPRLSRGASQEIHNGLWLFAETVPWTLWMFFRSVCRDTRESFTIAFLPFAFVFLPNVHVAITNFSALYALHFSNGVNFSLLLMGLYELLHNITADLSNSRRKFRNLVLLVLLAQILLIFHFETGVPKSENTAWIFSTRLAIFATALLVSLLYFQASAETLTEIFYSNRKDENQKVLSREAAELVRLLETEALYKKPDLSVAGLAKHVSIPEYKLREIIKNELGYKNFNTFINKLRIEYVVKQLEEKPDEPVAVIREDAGFKSHPPFNRAFRETYGVSPAEYRGKLKKAQPAIPFQG